MQPWEVMPWYGMVFGPIMMIIWLVIVIAVVVIRWVQGGAGPSFPFAGGRKRALDILEERFARGEIDKNEFEEKKRLLSD